MKIFLGVAHLVLSIVLRIVVLLQHRKQGGFSGIFGGGTQADAGQWQRFTGLTKLTVILATLFMLTSLALAFAR